MIKFFRNIRKSLLNQGKTTRYFKYAIGEIILVVIGILIALQINNWNTNNIQAEKEQVYLNNLKRDLQTQLIQTENQIEFESRIRFVAESILEMYKKNNFFKVDSTLTSGIGEISGRKTFVKNSPTYTELISSGNIDIISNNQLKDALIAYNINLERVEQVINKNNNLYTDAVFIPTILELTEVQLGNAYSNFKKDELVQANKSSMEKYIDLNQFQLRNTTAQLLSDPKNALKLINAINYRNHVSKVHIDILEGQKIETKKLIEKFDL